jgi:hypothetical protein
LTRRAPFITVTVIVTVTDPHHFTLDELVQRVTEEVTRLGIPQANGQVSTVPDGRTLRYYANLGLLDRPSEVRGRRAYYGARHLLQAVAVKALQAEGLPLQEIQHRLAGRSDEELRQLTARPSATRFWRTAPVAAAAPAPTSPRAPTGRAVTPPPEPVAVRLAPGLTLVIDPLRAPAPADIEAIRTAAEALVAASRRLGLIPTEQELP